jgi:hypothetical protein
LPQAALAAVRSSGIPPDCSAPYTARQSAAYPQNVILIETLSHDYSLPIKSLQIPKKVNPIFRYFLGWPRKVLELEAWIDLRDRFLLILLGTLWIEPC